MKTKLEKTLEKVAYTKYKIDRVRYCRFKPEKIVKTPVTYYKTKTNYDLTPLKQIVVK